jgi:hypothetical protein
LSDSAQKDKPGGSMSPFCEPATIRSTSHASIGKSAIPRLDTASTIEMAPVEAVTAAMPWTSCSTPVEDSLCCIRTALASGCSRSARANRSAGTVSPKPAVSATTLTP